MSRFNDEQHSAERQRLVEALRRQRQFVVDDTPLPSQPPPPLPQPCDDYDDGTYADDELPEFVERFVDTGECPCGGALATDGSRHYVWMAFLNYDNDEDGYRREQFGRDYRAIAVNWWTTVLSGSPIFHCQMFFWNQHQQSFVSFSVDSYAKRVWATPKKQFRRGWQFVRIEVSRQQELAMYHFFVAQLAAGKPFNSIGAYMLFFRPVDTLEESWFCSQLDVAALQRAGFLVGVAPHATSPAELYRLLRTRAEFAAITEETDNPVLSRPVHAVIGRRHVPVVEAAAAAAAANIDDVKLRF